MSYIAMSNNCWGRGKTIIEAIEQLKAAGGTSARGKMLLNYVDDPEAYVNDMGDICYHVFNNEIRAKALIENWTNEQWDIARDDGTANWTMYPVSRTGKRMKEQSFKND